MAQQFRPLQLEEIDNEVVLQGVTRKDIQEIFRQEFERAGTPGNIIVAFDVSYMMNFDNYNFEYIKKITWATRFDIGLMLDWQRQCERWFLDQTVRDDRGEWLKPIQIARAVDKVPNEGLGMLARAILGSSLVAFKYDEIGIGTGGVAYPSDYGLENPINRTDIIADSPGGSINRNGSTVYWVANHDKDIPTYDYTEGGIFDASTPAKDHCMNHSYFPGYVIHHLQGVDTINRTTTLYFCSS